MCFGGSANALASGKSRSRGLWIYDVFGMIPPPVENDLMIAMKSSLQVLRKGLAAALTTAKI